MRAALLLLALLAAGPALGDEATAAAEGFYGAYATFHPSDGIPDAQGRARYAPYISPALEQLLVQANQAEEKFARENKDSPPLIEGDLFTSNFEGATAHRLGPCRADAQTAQCPVELTYVSGPKDKPVTWTDTVHLIRAPSGWRVDDIDYGATWAFGNKGTLKATLKETIAFAPK